MVEQHLTPGGRVFAAVRPPLEVVMPLHDRLRTLGVPGRKVPPENWHVTLRYVGPIKAEAYDRWLAEIDLAPKPPPFSLRLGGLGAFPKGSRASVLWIGVDGDEVTRLAGVVDEAAEAAGLGREERPFRPHLTIARVRPPEDVRSLTERSGDQELSFRVDDFRIMAAVGSRYRDYETFTL